MKRIFKVIIVVLVAIILVICSLAFLTTRSEKESAPCINNLRQISAAKNSWSLDNHKTTNDIPTWSDILPYMNGRQMPVCPQGGTYTIGRVGSPPSCSIGGQEHTLPKGEN